MRGSFALGRSILTLMAGGLVAVSFALTASPSRAIDAAGPAPASTQPTPAKPTQSSYKPYFVEFRARSAASYGHMYVLYGKVNGRG